MPEPKPFKEQVEALAQERHLSISKLGWRAHDLDRKGTSQDTLNKALQGKRPLNDPIVEAVAKALDVPPETFVEYRLSRLRQALDWRQVGFHPAAELLEHIESSVTERDGRAFEQEIDAVLQQDASPSPNIASPPRSRRRRGSSG